MVFAPAANAVLGAVRQEEAGQASGATNAVRELGGVLGVAVLAAVFTGAGGFETPQAFVDGLVPAMWAGAAVLVAGGLTALLIPAKRRAPARGARAAAAAGRRVGRWPVRVRAPRHRVAGATAPGGRSRWMGTVARDGHDHPAGYVLRAPTSDDADPSRSCCVRASSPTSASPR